MRFTPKKYDKVILFFFVAFATGTYFTWLFEEQFDQDEWHSSPSRRYKMVDDIIDDKLFIGKSKSEIIEVLGRPVDPMQSEKDILNYKIGTPPSFSEHKREELIFVFENAVAIEAFRIRMDD